MVHKFLNPQNTVFVVLSFEGPDLYSLAGGLGIRTSNLTESLAVMEYPVHLFFIGDPKKKGEEVRDDRMYLHRWCQWISNYYPHGVYEGEQDKIRDFNRSIPPYLIENIIFPAAKQGKSIVVLGEEWHTAEVMSLLSDQLYRTGLRDNTIMFWNANNTFGFDRIDWKRLSTTTQITTVSRYMKRIMSDLGIDPLVIPNGIPAALLRPVDKKKSEDLRSLLDVDSVLTKIARWDTDKGWDTAIDTIYNLRADGYKATLLARGGIEPYGQKLIENARSTGLEVKDIYTDGENMEDYFKAIGSAAGADIINMKFHCPQELLKLMYHASDAVLANSRHEPFGLVGLETMAAGGVAITGGTGEDYAAPFFNSIVLETQDAGEIEDSLIYLTENPDESAGIRQNAVETARSFTWERVIQILLRKLEYQAYIQGLIGVYRTIESAVFNNDNETQSQYVPVGE